MHVPCPRDSSEPFMSHIRSKAENYACAIFAQQQQCRCHVRSTAASRYVPYSLDTSEVHGHLYLPYSRGSSFSRQHAFPPSLERTRSRDCSWRHFWLFLEPCFAASLKDRAVMCLLSGSAKNSARFPPCFLFGTVEFEGFVASQFGGLRDQRCTSSGPGIHCVRQVDV